MSVSSTVSECVATAPSASALYTAEQVVELERLVMEHEGLSASVLMKRAGRSAFEVLLKRWPSTKALHIFCGSGNNGGDGYVLAALAKQRNLEVTVWAVGEPKVGSTAERARDYALQEGLLAGQDIRPFDDHEFVDSQLMANAQTVIVDALLGTGTVGALRAPMVQAVEAINHAKCRHGWPVLSMDIPTGVNPDTGHVETHIVNADATISFIARKQGLYTGLGRANSGVRYFSQLQVNDEWLHLVNPSAHTLDLSLLLAELPERAVGAHKGDCGHLLVIGGDAGVGYGYGGAPIMAAQMALRTGAGLVSLATQPAFVSPALMRQPELMVAGVDSGQALLPMLARASVIAIGMGLGRSAWSEQLFYHVLEQSASDCIVLDADALHLLADERFMSVSPVSVSDRQWVLTPHPGEAAALLGCSIVEVEQNRIAAAQSIQQRYGGAVVLKGAGSVVVTNAADVFICDAGNPGMASGGMGDVLSGLIGALLAQGLCINNAAKLGALLHSTAADIAVTENGMHGLLATDLIPAVQSLMHTYCSSVPVQSS